MRQVNVLLGTAHLACAIRPSGFFEEGHLAPFTCIVLTDAGRSLLHSKVYFYRFWLCRTAFRTAIRGVGYFSFLSCFVRGVGCYPVPFVLLYNF